MQLMPKLLTILPIGLIVAGCTDFDEPATVDPSPVVGCYVAPEAPSLSVQSNGVRIDESPAVLPFHYEQRKVGMVLEIPMVASDDRGEFEIRAGDKHFYRVLMTNDGPMIRVAAYPDGTLRQYKRRSQNPC